MHVPYNIQPKKIYTDAQTDYPLGYIYMGNNSPCCPSPLPPSTPQVLLQFPLEDGGGVLGGRARMPLAVPPSTPTPRAQVLCGASLVPLPAPPWGRWQPSTVKGWGSHDGFHRWSVEIAGKDLSSVAQQRTWESQREIWVEKREMGRRETKRGCNRGWGGGRTRERRGRRRWCLFKESGVPKCKERVCLSELRVCGGLKWKMCKMDLFTTSANFNTQRRLPVCCMMASDIVITSSHCLISAYLNIKRCSNPTKWSETNEPAWAPCKGSYHDETPETTEVPLCRFFWKVLETPVAVITDR